MGITPTAFVTGTAITEAAMRTELDRVRNWVNTGMVITDIPDQTLDHTHVYRPETLGFPTKRTEATTQELYVDEGSIIGRSSAASFAGFPSVNNVADGQIPVRNIRERTSIFMQYLLEDETFIVPDMARRVVLDAASAEVEINAIWETTTQFNFNSSPVYPDVGGQFRLVHRTLGGSKVVIGGTGRRLNVHSFTVGTLERLPHNTYSTGASITLTPGTYDFWLEFERNGASLAVEQVIVGARSIVVEVHKT